MVVCTGQELQYNGDKVIRHVVSHPAKRGSNLNKPGFLLDKHNDSLNQNSLNIGLDRRDCFLTFKLVNPSLSPRTRLDMTGPEIYKDSMIYLHGKASAKLSQFQQTNEDFDFEDHSSACNSEVSSGSKRSFDDLLLLSDDFEDTTSQTNATVTGDVDYRTITNSMQRKPTRNHSNGRRTLKRSPCHSSISNLLKNATDGRQDSAERNGKNRKLGNPAM